jgi:hypothetical protein
VSYPIDPIDTARRIGPVERVRQAKRHDRREPEEQQDQPPPREREENGTEQPGEGGHVDVRV